MKQPARPRFDGDDPTWAIAATQPNQKAALQETVAASTDDHRDARAPQNDGLEPGGFTPHVPKSFHQAGLTESQVEALVLKFLLNCGSASGREVAEQVAMPFGLMETLLHSLKTQQLIVFRADAPVGDYVYELTESGTDRARRYSQQSTYFGAAPVPLDTYIESVRAQSICHEKPTLDGIRKAFGDMVLDEPLLCQLGEGMNSGLGFFLYGQPGNGKTSIAERVTGAYGQSIWIPRAISAAGEIIRLFDPTSHEVLPLVGQGDLLDEHQIDKRWIRIRRPTIVVGGELRLENLEVTTNPATGINEAPLQLKSNGGTLVIDDFGRQRFDPLDLLNRLIVPLEKRVDFLNMPSGRTFRVPFETMILFSTNLDPMELVDEAFLRRVPYKIDIRDPSESQFREVFKREAARMGIECVDDVVDYLLRKHYREADRRLRFCHPRDLLRQVHTACDFRNEQPRVTCDNIDTAVKNYLMLQARAQ